MEIQGSQILDLSEEDLLKFVKTNQKNKFSKESLDYILNKKLLNYPKIFYYLCISNKTFDSCSYQNTYLHKNYENFSEEDFYYICEGIKLQNDLQYCDFYLHSHHIFKNIMNNHLLQSLLIFLMADGGYRVREYIISSGLVEKIFQMSTEDYKNKLFFVKFITKAADMDSPVIIDFIISQKYSYKIKIHFDSLYFFKDFIKKKGKRLANVILVE